MSALTALWRSKIQESLTRNTALPYAKFAQLATVKLDGRPACRTVVFRGFLGETNDLMFITNSRSQKVEELGVRPDAELCWYFPETREQYRLTGSVKVVTGETADEGLKNARQDVWTNLSDAARTQFAWPASGQVRVDPPEAFNPPPPNKDSTPLPAFCLLVLGVMQVDFVELFPNKRTLFNLVTDESGARSWSAVDINP